MRILKKLFLLVLASIVFLTLLSLFSRFSFADENEEVAVVSFDVVSSEEVPEAIPVPEEIAAVFCTVEDQKLTITYHEKSQEDIEYYARSVYYSACDRDYEKFKYMNIVHNRTKYQIENGKYLYGRTVKENVTDRVEFAWWSSKLPSTERGKSIYNRNMLLAGFFIDYIESCREQGIAPLIPANGVIIGWRKNDAGENRFVDPYAVDKAFVEPTFGEDIFKSEIMPQFKDAGGY